MSVKDVPISNLIKIVNLLGLESVELFESFFQEPIEVINEFKGKNIFFHAPYKNDYSYDFTTIGNEGLKMEEFIQNINKTYDFSGGNIKGVVVHPPVEKEYNNEIFLKRIEKIKPIPLFENIFSEYGPINKNWNTFLKWFEEIEGIVNRKIGFCYDFPHAFINEGKEGFLKPPRYLLDVFRSNSGYAHISGAQEDKDTHAPLTISKMPIMKILNFLKQVEYNGVINMELSPMSNNTLDEFISGLIDSYLILLRNQKKSSIVLKKTYLKILEVFIKRKIRKMFPKLGEIKDSQLF
ncbi:MAG: hypothetical protein ACTSUV_07045 [Candidatus Ranarchaeia archaeon]